MTTPNVELDVMHRLVALFPQRFKSAGHGANLYIGEEVPQGGPMPRVSASIRLVGERQDLYGGGQARWFAVQLLQRFDPKAPVSARALARDLYDGLHTVAFTGQSGAVYVDCLYIDAPVLLTNAYFSHNFELQADT